MLRKDRDRVRIITPRQDPFVQLTDRRHRNVIAREVQIRLQEVHQVEVSADTVRRRLHESNPGARRLPLTLGARLVSAQEHILWTNAN